MLCYDCLENEDKVSTNPDLTDNIKKVACGECETRFFTNNPDEN
jgi:transcription elongation factor Elf1